MAETLPLRESTVIVARRALSIDHNNREYKEDLANALAALGDSLMDSLRVPEGIQSYLEAIDTYEALLTSDPENVYQQEQLFRAKITLLATSVYHPREIAKIPEVRFLIEDLTGDEAPKLAQALDLELL